ncbi:MAG: hypothetical protein CMP11_09445, partial [Zetaproteobacteria bacterium]|nr:hypothetical protein [Pseudobdellovibrionaceae bacterium]
MTLFYRHNSNYITLMGQTYPHRLWIKELGGTFQGARKVWRVPFSEKNLLTVNEYCTKHGGGSLSLESNLEKDCISSSVVKTEDCKDKFLATTLSHYKNPSQEESVKTPDSNRQVTRVSQLLSSIESLLAQTYPSAFWVVGEVQGLGKRSHGIFCQLAEKKDMPGTGSSLTVNCVIWSNDLQTLVDRHGKDLLDQIIADGVQICAFCHVHFYKARASVSLTIKDIDPSYTKGLLALEKEQTLKKIKEEGLE